ncbi:1-deoxy-D-xylulose 5-phosphate reductoisomerase [Alphaproteobacteria bacterium]|nr:1-deoxy-D-xylulose 5-phosphate reductoisomerase [Alphaproteobacteria bacterium]
MKSVDNKQKTISIFGSTGSIGKNAIAVIKNHPEKFKVTALVAQNNYKTLAHQALELKPEVVVIAQEKYYQLLKTELAGLKKCQIIAGQDAVNETAKIKCDLFISAIVGIAGMIPTLNAIKSASNIALANKEAMVCAGDFLLKEAKKKCINIFPIDSEHNALFQIFEKQNLAMIDDIVLTASGGPFFFSDINFKDITISQALKHPKWQMGNKISIDSATMMNKGLELIEAYYFFPLKKSQINILVHPQSIVHGIVNYQDGASLAMMSEPDMKVPISYALGFPKRLTNNAKKLSLEKIVKLEFFAVDQKKFPAIKLCRDALAEEGSALVVLNSANEIAVEKFLKGMIRFDQIYSLVSKTLEKIKHQKLKTIDEVIYFDQLARANATTIKI